MRPRKEGNMVSELEKMEKAKAVLMKIAKGVDPLTGEQIKEDSFLNNPKIIRCFYFVTEILDNVINAAYSKSSKSTCFIITPEQKSRVTFPEGKIGVNEFSRYVNMCIDLNVSKRLTGVEINRRLKKMGVLSEKVNPATGKMRTITNDSSINYGFETLKKSFNGVEYDMVVMNDEGKKYLLDNIEDIMSIDVK
jgi:hypothetical protein